MGKSRREAAGLRPDGRSFVSPIRHTPSLRREPGLEHPVRHDGHGARGLFAQPPAELRRVLLPGIGYSWRVVGVDDAGDVVVTSGRVELRRNTQFRFNEFYSQTLHLFRQAFRHLFERLFPLFADD